MASKIIYGILLISLLLLFLNKKTVATATNVAPLLINKNNLAIGETFLMSFKLDDIDFNNSYFVKCRVGPDSKNLNEGQTHNPITSNWFNDTDSWIKMPQIIATDEATISCRTKDSIDPGQKLVFAKACANSNNICNSNNSFQSVDYLTIEIATPSPTLTLTPTPTPTAIPTPSPTTIPSPTPTAVPTTSAVSYDNIYLSEVMVDPQIGEKEWVEIFNNNDFSVSLLNWYIDDAENSGSSPKIFSLDIPSYSYGIFDLPSSMFNNDGDSVRLLDFNKITKDSFEYSSSEKGKTWGRISLDDDNFCLQEPSKGLVNSSCLTNSLPPTTIVSVTNNPSPTKSIMNSATSIQISSSPKPVLKYQLNDYLNNNLLADVDYNNEIDQTNEQILGISQKNTNNYSKSLIKSLSFASLSFSFLTIFSIFLRIKFNI